MGPLPEQNASNQKKLKAPDIFKVANGMGGDELNERPFLALFIKIKVYSAAFVFATNASHFSILSYTEPP